MIAATVQYAKGAVKSLAPFLLCLTLLVFTILPYQVPFLHVVTPSIGLIAVFYWTVTRPEHMPIGTAFLLGLIPDLWSGGPPGLQALMLIVMRIFLLSQRRFIIGRSILVIWLAFGFLGLTWGAMIWSLASVYLGHALNIVPVTVQVLLTIAVYPPMSAFFGWFERTVLA